MFKGKNLQLVDKFWRLMHSIVIVVNNTALYINTTWKFLRKQTSEDLIIRNNIMSIASDGC